MLTGVFQFQFIGKGLIYQIMLVNSGFYIWKNFDLSSPQSLNIKNLNKKATKIEYVGVYLCNLEGIGDCLSQLGNSETKKEMIYI